MRACQECGKPVVLKNETRLWKCGQREVLLHAIDVYRCEDGHDHLVIPYVSDLIDFVNAHPDQRSFLHVNGHWGLYGEWGPLGQKLYVIEERELPDGNWACDDLLGFDTAEEAADAARKEQLTLDDCPAVEQRVVLYERREVVKFIKDATVSDVN